MAVLKRCGCVWLVSPSGNTVTAFDVMLSVFSELSCNTFLDLVHAAVAINSSQCIAASNKRSTLRYPSAGKCIASDDGMCPAVLTQSPANFWFVVCHFHLACLMSPQRGFGFVRSRSNIRAMLTPHHTPIP